MSMIKMTAAFALLVSMSGAIAGGLYREAPAKLSYKQEGKAVCFNTMIGIED